MLAFLESVRGDVADRHADQLEHRMADRVAHAADLPVETLGQPELVPHVAAGLAEREELGQRSRDRAVVELDPVAQRLLVVVAQLALELDVVGLHDAVARVRERLGELAVVGQQHDAARVVVETTDRVEPLADADHRLGRDR